MSPRPSSRWRLGRRATATTAVVMASWLAVTGSADDADIATPAPSTTTSTTAAAPTTTAAAPPSTSAAPDVIPLAAVRYDTGTTESGLAYRVALPVGYVEDGAHPVLLHLHGATQSWEALETDVAALADMLGQAVEAGTLPPIVVVAPHDATGWSMWTDSHSGEYDVTSMILDELIPEFETTYAIAPGAESRLLQGFSMGGFGAASIGLGHPDQFASVSVWDGAMHDWESMSGDRPWITTSQFGDDEAFFRARSPWELAEAVEPGTARLLVIEALMEDFAVDYTTHLEELGHAPTSLRTGCPHDVPCIADAAGPEITEFLAASLAATMDP